MIAQESERLSRVAADILLANRIDSGRLQLETTPLDVARLAEDVVEQMRSCFAERDDVTLMLVSAEPGSFVAGDEDKLRQVLINLVDNAVKYSPDGGAVEIRVEPNVTNLRVSVRDKGLGIPHGEQQRIFGKFYRVDPQLSRGVGGTGLGLYICRELVRRMDGRLTVSSKEGEGSTFVVELPLAAAPAAEPGRSGRAARLISVVSIGNNHRDDRSRPDAETALPQGCARQGRESMPIVLGGVMLVVTLAVAILLTITFLVYFLA